MAKKQFVEGKLKECEKNACRFSCCDDGEVEEWVNEYFLFHERIKEHLIAQGIKILFEGDRVKFLNCSDGKRCKFLTSSLNKDIDPRPIDCKIYPYEIDWDNINFDEKIVELHFWDKECPLVKKNKIDKKFKQEVEMIIKRDFTLLFGGARFSIKFIDKDKN